MAILLTHQHYDHTKDILTLAMNMYLSGATLRIYSTLPVYNALASRLFDGELYPTFLQYPEGNPTLKYHFIEPLRVARIEGYDVLAAPVKHSVPAVSYKITSPDVEDFVFGHE